MDLGLTPTSTISADYTETDTPPHTHNQPINLLPSTNGAFQHHRLTPPHAVAAYKECMKNHAAAIGGHAVDGCGEFISSHHHASPPDPTSLKCAACGCHRNFHRREPDTPSTVPITPQFLDFRRPSPPPILYPTHGLLALSTAVAAEDDRDRYQAPLTPIGENPVGRKRSRTKFSQEQKEKMQSFSEKLGWRMQRCDEASVEEFCNEIGVAKGVLKVWMHNNKNKETGNRIVNGGIIDFENNGGGKIGGGKTDNGGQFRVGGVRFHGSNDGSCSST